MDDFRQFVERVRDANDIADVMPEIGSEFRLAKRGTRGWFYGEVHDSLAANPTTGMYAWFSRSPAPGQTSKVDWEQGDVFAFLERHGNMEFMQALEYLAQRAGLEMPKLGREKGEAEVKTIKAREAILDVATGWFEDQLWKTPAALAYARSRGWSDETIRSVTRDPQGQVLARGAALGYSGGSKAATSELRDLLLLNGCDVYAPEAVALVGLQGGVLQWCQSHGIKPDQNWLERDRIWGITDFPRLVYPLRKFGSGRTLYFHCRNLVWEENNLRGVRDGEDKPKMHNPPVELLGDRPLFLNHIFAKHAAQIVIVEGPGDAVTLGQWKTASIALNGLGVSDQLRSLLITQNSNAVMEGRVYSGLDNDERGRAAVAALGELLGGMLRVIMWKRPETKRISQNEANDE